MPLVEQQLKIDHLFKQTKEMGSIQYFFVRNKIDLNEFCDKQNIRHFMTVFTLKNENQTRIQIK